MEKKLPITTPASVLWVAHQHTFTAPNKELLPQEVPEPPPRVEKPDLVTLNSSQDDNPPPQ